MFHKSKPNPTPAPEQPKFKTVTVQAQPPIKSNIYASGNLFLQSNDSGFASFIVPEDLGTIHIKVEPWDTSYKAKEQDFDLVKGNALWVYLDSNYIKRTGNVHIVNRSAVDDQGYHLFMGTTLFPYRSMRANDPVRLNTNLIYAAKKKVEYIRYFVEVGPAIDDPNDGWNDRKCDPNTFSADDVNYCYDNFGIRSAISIFGGCFFSNTPEKRRATVQRVIDVVKSISQKVIWIEIVNEYKGQLDDAVEICMLADYVQSQLPNTLVITSSSEQWQDGYNQINNLGKSGSLGSCHHERTNKENGWGYVRGPYSLRELGNVPAAFTDDEGEGPKSSIAEDANPLRQAFVSATSYITRSPFKTIHFGAGVYMGGKGGVSHNREANLWEVENADLIFDFVNNIRELLPQDVTSWPEYNGNMSEHLLPADHVWADGFNDGVLRTYMAIAGNRFAMLPYSIMNFSDHKPKINMHVKVYDITNKVLITDTDLNVPSTLKLMGRPDCNSGYLVLGTF